MPKFTWISIFLVFCLGHAASGQLVWPTESKAFAQGKPRSEFIQPTVSGVPKSGEFGDVRNNGYRFHEGIDIKPVRKNRKGEPLDDIYAAMDGRVAMVNRIAGNSSYGRYVVLVHPHLDVEIYTLYAHLAEVDASIVKGIEVKSGSRLGKMGRSATYAIGRAQAHLHFEVGLRLSDSFDKWYRTQKYKEKNFFGNYNGMNLIGFDPLDLYEAAKENRLKRGIAGYLDSLPTALVVRIYTRSTPQFVKIYPNLVYQNGNDCGWDIHFTWYGLPKKFERIKDPRLGAKEGDVEILKYDAGQLKRKCRKMMKIDKKGQCVPTRDLISTLRKIFL